MIDEFRSVAPADIICDLRPTLAAVGPALVIPTHVAAELLALAHPRSPWVRPKWIGLTNSGVQRTRCARR